VGDSFWFIRAEKNKDESIVGVLNRVKKRGCEHKNSK
jgi:hypothetical protein